MKKMILTALTSAVLMTGCKEEQPANPILTLETKGTFETLNPTVAALVDAYPKLSAFRQWMTRNGDICGGVYIGDGHYKAYALKDPTINGTAKDFANERDARVYVEQYCKP